MYLEVVLTIPIRRESTLKVIRRLFKDYTSNLAQFYLNGFASFDSTKEKFEVLSSSRDSLSLTAIKGDGRLEHEKEATEFAVRYML